jgi:predicted small lipoprotein YifL
VDSEHAMYAKFGTILIELVFQKLLSNSSQSGFHNPPDRRDEAAKISLHVSISSCGLNGPWESPKVHVNFKTGQNKKKN